MLPQMLCFYDDERKVKSRVYFLSALISGLMDNGRLPPRQPYIFPRKSTPIPAMLVIERKRAILASGATAMPSFPFIRHSLPLLYTFFSLDYFYANMIPFSRSVTTHTNYLPPAEYFSP